MCGRTAMSQAPDALQRSVKVSDGRWRRNEKYRPSCNVGPGRYQPILVRESDGSRGLVSMRWGLIPHWQKGQVPFGEVLKTINARAETVATKPTYRGLVKDHRCAVLCDGFFEWKTDSAKEKQPYFIYFPDKRTLTLAGLYSHWVDKETGEDIDSYTIITTDSNKQLSWLHDRMPAILPDEKAIDEWLDQQTPFETVAEKYLHPYTGELKWHPVHRDVGNVKNDRPDLVKEIKTPKKITSFFSKVPKGDASEHKPVTPVKRAVDSADDEATASGKKKMAANSL